MSKRESKGFGAYVIVLTEGDSADPEFVVIGRYDDAVTKCKAMNAEAGERIYSWSGPFPCSPSEEGRS